MNKPIKRESSTYVLQGTTCEFRQCNKVDSVRFSLKKKIYVVTSLHLFVIILYQCLSFYFWLYRILIYVVNILSIFYRDKVRTYIGHWAFNSHSKYTPPPPKIEIRPTIDEEYDYYGVLGAYFHSHSHR